MADQQNMQKIGIMLRVHIKWLPLSTLFTIIIVTVTSALLNNPKIAQSKAQAVITHMVMGCQITRSFVVTLCRDVYMMQKL